VTTKVIAQTIGGRMAANMQTVGFKLVVHDVHRQSASRHLVAQKF